MPNPKGQNRFSFDPERAAQEVELCIAKHVGEQNAISIERLCIELWGYRWYSSVPDSYQQPTFPYRALLQRRVKQIARELRRSGKKIGSTRGSKTCPPGYYMITNSAELAKTVAPMVRQAIDELGTVEALTGKNFYTAELAGQQRLFQVTSAK